MTRFLLRRFLQGTLVVCAAFVAAFFGTHVIGDPLTTILNQDASPEETARTARAFGLDQPLPIQFLRFLGAIFTNDLGDSFVYGKPALSLVLSRLPATFELAFLAFAIALTVGIPAGLWAGLRPRAPLARALTLAAIGVFSIPTFWLALLLAWTFSIKLGVLPASGRGPTIAFGGLELSILTLEGLRHAFLPALSLAIHKICLMIRLMKAETARLTKEKHIVFARAQGLGSLRICGRILKNAAGPILAVIGLEFGALMALSIVTETIFSWPGGGRLLLEAILKADRPVIVAYGLVTAVVIVTVNIFVDAGQRLLDPRAGAQREGLS